MALSYPQWATALDLDFTTQITATLGTDTTFNVGVNPYTGNSLVWTKVNSANEATAMQLTNGSGLVIKPAAATNISGSSFTAPALRIPLNSIIPDWTIFMPFRIWVWVSNTNVTANNDQMVFGTFIATSGVANQLTYSHWQGYAGATNGYGSQVTVLNSSVTATSTSVPFAVSPLNPSTATTNNVGIMACPGGVLGGSSPLLIGSSSTSNPITTTIAAGSSGQTLPGTGNVINVASTAGFAPLGSFYVTSSTGSQLISYTGTTSTSFTGCTVANNNATPGTITVNALVSQGTWPTINSLSFVTAAQITDAASAAIASSGSGAITVPNVNLFLAAQRNGSGTALSVTISRIRVDFIPINN